MRIWILALVVAIAGCASSPTTPGETTDSTTGETGGNGTASPSNGTVGAGSDNGTPEAPVWVAFDSDVTSGEAPLVVTFSIVTPYNWTADLDGDDVTDHEGFGNDSIAMEFDTPGIYVAWATAFRGGDAVSVNHTIEVFETIVHEVPQPIVWKGTVTIPDAFAFGGGCIMPLADFAGSGLWGPIENVPAGVGDWEFSASPASVWVTFIDAAGNIYGNGNSGTVGEDATEALICATAPLVDFTVTVEAP